MADKLGQDRQRLVSLLRERAVQRGDFTLSSGRRSEVYIDARTVVLSAQGSYYVATTILAMLHSKVVAVGGMAVGAVPIVAAMAACSYRGARSVQAFYARSTRKAHGMGYQVEGTTGLRPGAWVCIVEDVTTTGTSLLHAAAAAQDAGLRVAQCVTLVDRDEGAADLVLDTLGVELQSITTAAELLEGS